MFFNTAEVSAFLSQIPPALLSEAATRRLTSFVCKFPRNEQWTTNAAHNGTLGLEFRLCGNDQVDVALPLTRHDGDTLLRLSNDKRYGAWLTANEPWQCFMDLLRLWAAGDTVLGRDRLFWIEWDIESEASEKALPAPKVFVPVQNGPIDPTIMYGHWRLSYLASLIEALTKREPPKALLERLGEGLSSLPRDAYIRYMGLRCTRGPEGVRLSCGGLPVDRIAPWLERIGWVGAKNLTGYMYPLLQSLSSSNGQNHIEYVNIDFDLFGEPRPTVGLEFPLQARGIQHGILEKGFLDKLIDLKLAQPAKVEALVQVPSATLVEEGTARGRPKYKYEEYTMSRSRSLRTRLSMRRHTPDRRLLAIVEISNLWFRSLLMGKARGEVLSRVGEISLGDLAALSCSACVQVEAADRRYQIGLCPNMPRFRLLTWEFH